MSDEAAGPPAKTSSTDHAVVSTIVTLAPTETMNSIDAATSPDATAAALWNCISYHGRPAKLKRLLTPALETDDLADSLRYDRESWLDGDYHDAL